MGRVKENRRFIVTDAGEKQYITDADIRFEAYCDECGKAFDAIQGEDCIYLQIRGGWQKKPHGIPEHHQILLLHEECTPLQIRTLFRPLNQQSAVTGGTAGSA